MVSISIECVRICGKSDARISGLLVTLYAHQLAQLPLFKLGRRIEAVRVVDIGLDVLRVLCKDGGMISSALGFGQEWQRQPGI